jgi:hypothetical protein
VTRRNEAPKGVESDRSIILDGLAMEDHSEEVTHEQRSKRSELAIRIFLGKEHHV